MRNSIESSPLPEEERSKTIEQKDINEGAFLKAQETFFARDEIKNEFDKQFDKTKKLSIKKSLDALQKTREEMPENILYDPRLGLSIIEQDISLIDFQIGGIEVSDIKTPKELLVKIQEEFDALREDKAYETLAQEAKDLQGEKGRSLHWYAQEILGYKPGTKEYEQIAFARGPGQFSELMKKVDTVARDEDTIGKDLQKNTRKRNQLIREKCPVYREFMEEHGGNLEKIEEDRMRIYATQDAYRETEQEVVKRYKAEIEELATQMLNR